MNGLDAMIRRRALRLAGGDSRYHAAFAGAIHNRLTADWILAGIQSADQEVRQNLRVLKARSRELARNNPHAAHYLRVKADNVLGDEGIQLQAEVREADGSFAQRVNQQIEDAWREWGEVGTCTADGRHAWQDVERLLVTEDGSAGDAFLRLLPAWSGNRFGFSLQLIDPDQVDVDYNVPRGPGQNEIRMGVEIDDWGRAVAFHVWTSHPSEPDARGRDRRERVPADQMVHWFQAYRIGQTRGVPDFTPVLLTQKMLEGYEQAELVAARTGAAKGGFFERTAEAVNVLQDAGDPSDRFVMEVEPGLFETLPPGWKFSQWDPTHPTNAFPDFHKAMLRTIAAGLGVSYHRLAQDLEGVSFSSIRDGTIAERDHWRVIQGNMWRHVHTRVYREWLLWSLTTGALRLPSRDPRAFYRVRWQARGWDWVDPAKDADSADSEVALGVNSRTRIAAAKGRNFEDVVEELARERELMIAAGLDPDALPGTRRSRSSADDDDAPAPPAATLPHRLELLLTNGRAARTGLRVAPHRNGNGARHA